MASIYCCVKVKSRGVYVTILFYCSEKRERGQCFSFPSFTLYLLFLQFPPSLSHYFHFYFILYFDKSKKKWKWKKEPLTIFISTNQKGGFVREKKEGYNRVLTATENGSSNYNGLTSHPAGRIYLKALSRKSPQEKVLTTLSHAPALKTFTGTSVNGQQQHLKQRL